MSNYFSRTKLGILVLFFLTLLIVVSYLMQNRTDKILGANLVKVFNVEFESEGKRALNKIVQNNLSDKEGIYAVYIESLTSPGDKYSFNENEIMPAASLYKLILMAAVYKAIEGGNLKKDDVVVGSKDHLADVLGDVDFGYEEAPEKISYTTEEALRRVAAISDNFAAIMLTEKLREIRATTQDKNGLLLQMTQELGMDSTSFATDPTTTTARDVSTFFKRLYDGQVVSKTSSEEILELLSKSRLNSRIPAYLPEDLKISHKTGELPGIRHDAGIVFLPDNPYIIILMSKDIKYEDTGVETLAQISKEVYEYFAQRYFK